MILRQEKLNITLFALILVMSFSPGCSSDGSGGSSSPLTADHTIARLSILESIPASAINNAKSNLHIAYGHTSHGSQIRTGLDNLDTFMGGSGLYDFYDITDGDSASAGYLDFRDYDGNFGDLGTAQDLGNPDMTSWEAATRTYLDGHPDVNVIVWSWCGQVSSATESDINTYLKLMNALESDYPDIKFVYMTGHLNGTGTSGNLHIRNEQIRAYCRTNGKILFDFADIESYDPDGNCFLDLNANDACGYDGGNWATEWQGSHTINVDWYDCSSAHSEPLNANMKAYAFWWLLARLAGWEG